MGQCYDVRLRVSFNDEQGAVNALQAKIGKGESEGILYSLGHYKDELGIGTDTIGDLLRIFFSGWDGEFSENDGELEAGFNASYGWESVMMDAFDEIAPFLADGSSIKIYCDEGIDEAVVANGSSLWVR